MIIFHGVFVKRRCSLNIQTWRRGLILKVGYVWTPFTSDPIVKAVVCSDPHSGSMVCSDPLSGSKVCSDPLLRGMVVLGTLVKLRALLLSVFVPRYVPIVR